MVVVAWVSRHKPLPAQISELKKRLGNDARIIKFSKIFKNAEEVYREIRSFGARYAVVVLPLSMISVLTAQYKDVVWLWSEMEVLHRNCKGTHCPEYNPDTDVILESFSEVRHFRFRGFKRILKVEMVAEPW